MIANRLDYKSFIRIIDHHYDEINIWDSNYKLLYINKACERHYGLKKEDMIGRDYYDFIEDDYWYPLLLPHVYKEKVPLMMNQHTHIGTTITSIVIPIFDENDEIEYVVSTVRDSIENIHYLTVDEIEKRKYEERHNLSSSMLYKSKKMTEVMELAYKLSDVESPIVILGESGVGKTLLARVMHNSSKRKDKPFININCGAIPAELMESELFGYAEGSFTGAKKQGKKGIFDAANGGTLLLDEISELPYLLQSKLLQVVQDKEFMPVGSSKVKRVDVKIIAATNRDLKKLVDAGSFREDLYYRLSVFEINVPPLRERKEDIEIMAFYFLNQFNETYKKNHQLSQEALSVLKNYSWRGNTRELSHLIERLVVTVNDFIIKPSDLPSSLFVINPSTIFSRDEGFDEMIDDFKKNTITEAYNKYKSSRKVAAKLKISQSKASRLIRQYLGDQVDLNDD
jgi:PAS domain S-box-containing protein